MNGSVRSSAGMVWRHQRLVWWIFAVNLVIAWLASLPSRATLSAVLDHSLESARMVTGFDVSSFVLMLQRPDVSTRTVGPAMMGAAFLFLVYLLFVDGGVMAVYLDDRKLSRAEFFENSGLFFWRMVRLALYSLIPLGVVAMAHGTFNKLTEKLSSDAPQERLGFFVNLAGMLGVLLLSLLIRMWFDLAQARVVKDNERQLLRTVWRSLKLAFRSGRLYASYLGVGVFAAATFGLGTWIWILLPHRAMGASFVVLEAVTAAQIASRLWMKAASARWVALLPEAALVVEVVVPVESPVMVVEPVVDEPPVSE